MTTFRYALAIVGLALAGCHLVFPYAGSDAAPRDRGADLTPDHLLAPDLEQTIPFETISQGRPPVVNDPELAKAHTRVIQYQATLDAYLAAVQVAPVQVDFAANVAVAVGLGPQGSDAVTAEIEAIARVGGSVEVRYVELDRCVGATVETHPYHVVKLARQQATFIFQKRKEDCCAIKTAEIQAMLADIGACSADSDCVVAIGEGCPFYSCYFYKNKNKDDKALRAAVAEYKSLGCTACPDSCNPAPAAPPPACSDHVCKPK